MFRALAKLGLLGLAVAVLAACSGNGDPVSVEETYDADRVVIRDFIGRLTIETAEAGGEIELRLESRSDQVDILPRGVRDGVLTIEWYGEPDRERGWWEFWRGRWAADLDRLDDYPDLVLMVPDDTEIEILNITGEWKIDDRDAHLVVGADRGVGVIGATNSLDLRIAGDAEVEHGPVAGLLEVSIAGSGSVSGGTAGSAAIAIAGSGDIIMGGVAGDVSVDIAGSGEAIVGNAARARTSISGSGNVRFGALDGSLDATIRGSGHVFADSVAGGFSATISGSGSVEVAAGRAAPFDATISGSGDVQFNGTAVDPSAVLSGSGDVFIAVLEGNLSSRTSGSGRVEIGAGG